MVWLWFRMFNSRKSHDCSCSDKNSCRSERFYVSCHLHYLEISMPQQSKTVLLKKFRFLANMHIAMLRMWPRNAIRSEQSESRLQNMHALCGHQQHHHHHLYYIHIYYVIVLRQHREPLNYINLLRCHVANTLHTKQTRINNGIEANSAEWWLGTRKNMPKTSSMIKDSIPVYFITILLNINMNIIRHALLCSHEITIAIS